MSVLSRALGATGAGRALQHTDAVVLPLQAVRLAVTGLSAPHADLAAVQVTLRAANGCY